VTSVVVTPSVVASVTFVVATPLVGAATTRICAVQRGQDCGSDDGSQYPLHGFHRFTPARRTGRHGSQSITRRGRLPREGEAGASDRTA
jgi:hypothetical protein